MRKYLIRFFLITSIIIFYTNKSFAGKSSDFVQSAVNKASIALSSNNSKDIKIKKLKEIALESVDISGIGFYTLGKHRKTLNNEQKDEYNRLFSEYFLKSFSSRLAEYTDPKINVVSEEKINENYVIVSSVLVATEERPEVKVDWRIYTKNPDKLLIRDLIIEGLSLARTQKEEFNSIIQNNDGDINALFENLKNFIN
tara:strand:- start:54 stop:647 length:594 start_codon:yes stop_codon:yes gene_type:complete